MKIQSKKAFTLAEVLLTLFIIGVVAAETIPTLVKSYQNQVKVTKVKKYTSVLNQVIKQYMADKECIGNIISCGAFVGDNTHQDSWNAIKVYFREFPKDCVLTDGSGCFPAGVKYKFLNGQEGSILDDDGGIKAIMPDGASMNFYDYSGDCSSNRSHSSQPPLLYTCGYFYIDINGHRPPNQYGRDMFKWFVTRSGQVVPAGSQDDSLHSEADGTPDCDPNDSGTFNDPGGGRGCAGKIMREGAVNY